MTFGGRGYWTAIGHLNQEEVNQIVRIAYEHGINFIDTANAYSEGLAEQLLGNAIRELGLPRQNLFIATKVRLRMGEGVNQVGLSRLHILDSVNESLMRMGISHIDMLYLHGVDPLTPLEETMRAMEDLVRSGKIRYPGVSNHPAWMVVKANAVAERTGGFRFVATQNYYTIASRDIEREIVPMALSEGMSIIPWSPLAGGFLSGKFTRENAVAGESRRDNFDFPPLNKDKAYDIIEEMARTGSNYSASPARVALSWLRERPGVTSVIIGVKTREQLLDDIASTELTLSEDDKRRLDDISSLNPEYPGWMVERQLSGRFPG